MLFIRVLRRSFFLLGFVVLICLAHCRLGLVYMKGVGSVAGPIDQLGHKAERDALEAEGQADEMMGFVKGLALPIMPLQPLKASIVSTGKPDMCAPNLNVLSPAQAFYKPVQVKITSVPFHQSVVQTSSKERL